MKPIDSAALDQLFRTARSHNGWTDRPVTEEQLRNLYDLLKMGPTSANSCPVRFVWVQSAQSKAALFAAAVRYADFGVPRGVACGDVDGDGSADVVLTTGRVVVLRNDGRGALGAPVTYAAGADSNAVALTDFNGDGRLDIVCIGSATANLKWYENKGTRK